jgi:MraZ protein
VSDLVFQGPTNVSLDAKGRWTVPAKHREALQKICGNELTLTKHPDGCLLLFPRPAWLAFRTKVMSESGSWYRRVYIGGAQDVSIDSAERINVAPELRDAAGLVKDAQLMGMGAYFELWDLARYKVYEQNGSQLDRPDDPLGSFTFAYPA